MDSGASNSPESTLVCGATGLHIVDREANRLRIVASPGEFIDELFVQDAIQPVCVRTRRPAQWVREDQVAFTPRPVRAKLVTLFHRDRYRGAADPKGMSSEEIGGGWTWNDPAIGRIVVFSRTKITACGSLRRPVSSRIAQKLNVLVRDHSCTGLMRTPAQVVPSGSILTGMRPSFSNALRIFNWMRQLILLVSLRS